jgi:hypothetical protein
LPWARGAGDAGLDALLDNGPLEFRKDTEHLEQCPARGGGGVNSLLVQVEVAAHRAQLAEEAYEVLERATKPIHAPGHHHVDLASQQ